MTDFKLTVAQDKAMDVLVSDATHDALGGGSRSGKTFLLVRAVIIRALKANRSRHAIFRYRFNALKASIVLDTLPKVIALCFPTLPSADSMMNKTDWFMTLPNGSEIWFGGLDDKERTEKVLGMEFATIYFNECSQIPWSSITLALTRLAQKTETLALKAYYDFNPPSKVHWTYLQFVEKKNPENKRPLKNPFDYGFYLINPADNRENLDAKYLEMLDGLPAKARDRFLLGKFADDSDGALWTVEILDHTRIVGGSLPDFLRIVVAVDPSGCSGPEDTRSDMIGIAVVALGVDGHGYVLEDLTGHYGPAEWGKVACDAYQRRHADRVVGEENYGGAMVEHVVQTAASDLGLEVAYCHVNATRGKTIRAEPVAALYEQGKVHHVGYFSDMEDEMCSMTMGGYMGLKSPNRLDAVVWGVTEIFPGLTQRQADQDWTPPQKHVQSRRASRFDNPRRMR